MSKAATAAAATAADDASKMKQAGKREQGLILFKDGFTVIEGAPDTTSQCLIAQSIYIGTPGLCDRRYPFATLSIHERLCPSRPEVPGGPALLVDDPPQSQNLYGWTSEENFASSASTADMKGVIGAAVHQAFVATHAGPIVRYSDRPIGYVHWVASNSSSSGSSGSSSSSSSSSGSSGCGVRDRTTSTDNNNDGITAAPIAATDAGCSSPSAVPSLLISPPLRGCTMCIKMTTDYKIAPPLWSEKDADSSQAKMRMNVRPTIVARSDPLVVRAGQELPRSEVDWAISRLVSNTETKQLHQHDRDTLANVLAYTRIINPICSGCGAKTNLHKWLLCQRCVCTWYCTATCQARHAKTHVDWCCRRDGPRDVGFAVSVVVPTRK